MGLFLSASGVIGADSVVVERSVGTFVKTKNGTFESRSGTTEDPNIAVITQGDKNTTILHPREFMEWDELSQHLSKDLQAPVFSFHIHDGDLWMFLLFDKGEMITQFNPIPDYWGELDPSAKASWSGDAEAVCLRVPGLSPDSIKNCFVEWTEEVSENGGKAYSDDEFEYGTDWQLTDFMRRVGLKYPIRNDGTPDGQTFHLRIRRPRGGQ